MPTLVVRWGFLIMADACSVLGIHGNGRRWLYLHRPTLTVDDLKELWKQLQYNVVTVVQCSSLLGFLLGIYFMTQPRPVYLVDFALHKGRDDQKCTHELFMERSRLTGFFIEQTMTFQTKILERSGLGQLTYLPNAFFNIPAPNPCMAEARKEAEAVVFGAVDQVLAKTGVKPKDIGILVVNSSLFNPIPSLSAMIVNHYKLRSNIKSFNLGGMGCSAGVISVDLAKKLLQVGFVFFRCLGHGIENELHAYHDFGCSRKRIKDEHDKMTLKQPLLTVWWL
ncbi:3-ketoacyl-CoA synthase 11-like protein [Cinnamomum micranthum f. kanehirae]|uniref:3-ketoacyl-CoA synthase 11-like protein n=1 Tax=Cinnamomum micranthum f. kanehirae TaxID=337451 RepID=A0A3S3MYT0_9MAGN|nr:3-ketoacyl-CoA synthase 11-like protein [Cinnamomum micranthum f. kanehirae]